MIPLPVPVPVDEGGITELHHHQHYHPSPHGAAPHLDPTLVAAAAAADGTTIPTRRTDRSVVHTLVSTISIRRSRRPGRVPSEEAV